MKLQFDKNVMHNGMTILGRQVKDNKIVFDGSIVDLDTDTRGLKEVAQSLIDRGYAHETQAAATHTTNFVNAAQQAMPLDAQGGSAPIADSLKRNLAAKKELMNKLNQTPQNPAEPAAPTVMTNSSPAPAPVPAGQPSAEEIAETAANA